MLPQQPLITGRRHMVVAGHYLATEAGLKILEAGGNAVDAGVAAGIALGVLHSDQVQFSGVAPMLIYIKKLNKVISVAGLGHWPKAANLEFFEKKIFYDSEISVNQINKDFLDNLELLEPHGKGNEEPQFLIKDIVIDQVKNLKNKHILIFFKNKNTSQNYNQ